MERVPNKLDYESSRKPAAGQIIRKILGNRLLSIGMLIVALGWVLFVVSFFLPATNVVERGGTEPGTPLVGWDAALSSIRCLGAEPLAFLAEPSALLFLFLPVTNILVLISPVLAVGRPRRAFWVALILLPVSLLILMLPKDLVGDVFVGFYAWVGSYVIVSVGCVVISFLRPGIKGRD